MHACYYYFSLVIGCLLSFTFFLDVLIMDAERCVLLLLIFLFSVHCLSLVQDDPFGNSDPFASAFPSSTANHSDGFDAFGASWPSSNSSHQVRARDGQTWTA